ncbi:MAG: response regulator [Anaerolineales bacterium]
MSFSLRNDLLQGWRVLVVDDDPVSIEIAETLLRMCGADVGTAPNGQEGLARAQNEKPDFIVSDLSMPHMDGWEMVKRLKNDRATADIPVIALTAHAKHDDRTRAIAAGFHNYLSKPLDPTNFVRDLLTLLLDVPELGARARALQDEF